MIITSLPMNDDFNDENKVLNIINKIYNSIREFKFIKRSDDLSVDASGNKLRIEYNPHRNAAGLHQSRTLDCLVPAGDLPIEVNYLAVNWNDTDSFQRNILIRNKKLVKDVYIERRGYVYDNVLSYNAMFTDIINAIVNVKVHFGKFRALEPESPYLEKSLYLMEGLEKYRRAYLIKDFEGVSEVSRYVFKIAGFDILYIEYKNQSFVCFFKDANGLCVHMVSKPIDGGSICNIRAARIDDSEFLDEFLRVDAEYFNSIDDSLYSKYTPQR